jgi:hypothetical protein
VIKVERGGYVDVAFLSDWVQAAASGLSQDLYSDGVTTFYSETTGGEFSQWMLQGGSLLRHGTDTLASASVASNWALAVMDSVSYEGHSGTAATLYLSGLGFVPQSVLGWGVVQGWQYDSNLDRLEITLVGPGRFTIHKDFIVEAGMAVEGAMHIWPNPATSTVAVRLSAAQPRGSWQLMDLQGRLLAEGAFDNGQFDLNITGFAPGIYLIAAFGEDGLPLGTQKLVVE